MRQTVTNAANSNKMRQTVTKSFVLNFAAITASALFFSVSFPNPLFSRGLGFAGFFAYIPLLAVIGRAPLRHCVFYGAWYGLVSTALSNYWLYNFHPFALPLACTILMAYYAVFFPILRAAVLLFPRRHYLPQCLLWVGFEYCRSLGFLGYTFGISGYTQWRFLPLIQSASLGGVWVVSAILIFPQTLAASVVTRFCLLRDKNQEGGSLPLAPAAAAAPSSATPSPKGASAPLKTPAPSARALSARALAPTVIPAAAYLAVLAGFLVYGFLGRPAIDGLPQRRIALIQQNDDPWKDGVEEYRKTLGGLKTLSSRALAQSTAEDRPVDLVVWPETAFVPMIYWHTRYRTDNAYYQLVKELTDYLTAQDAPFLIGNDDGRRETREGRIERVDYNAALLFWRGELAEVYRKQRLVPFSEYFPYKKQLPFFYALLQNAGVTFWEPGAKPVIFEIPPEAPPNAPEMPPNQPPDAPKSPEIPPTPPQAGQGGFRFAAPICFEDSFGGISRQFTRLGADILVNMTNDSWGKSLSCQNQHLAMSVFRAVENRRSVVRAATSGQTCAIAPDGSILAEAPPFTAAFVNADVPIASGQTFYTKHGDFFPLACLAAAALLLIFGPIRVTIRKRKV
ncbi:MAG: apolipoprotein N-acyltransferase [Spirochaetaceae bacterium]|jgi:apolipoprotein N-acyltransferase|nr:apolipoprotein N-acyltransferase [Spirochaetaceae bacterium]